MKKSCKNCYWNYGICHGKELRKKIEETLKIYPNGCEYWRISIEALTEIEEEKQRQKIIALDGSMEKFEKSNFESMQDYLLMVHYIKM